MLVPGPDNAATELLQDGVNGVLAASGSPADLARAIVRVHAAGRPLRDSTIAWFEANAKRLSIDSSLEAVASAYAADSRARS